MIINPMELLSLVLVISFFIFHNIYLVIFGMCLALFLINKNNSEILVKTNKKKIINKEVETVNHKHINETRIEAESECSPLSLVEAIEEYGFIPTEKKQITEL